MAEYRKKLIEVALPLKEINEQSAREKSIRHGHPSTLHLWWARRPLAACRAVLFAQLVDDPSSDPAYRRPDGSVDEERAGIKRAELFNLIEELVRWENSNNPDVVNRAKAEIARCVASRKIELGELQKETIVYGRDEGKEHPDGPLPNDGRFTAWQVNCRLAPPEAVNHFLQTYAPPVLDPFAGGGSIPLEAQRLGLRAHASDLNPVPVLINKALIEIPPKFAGLPPVNPGWQQKSREEKTLQSSWQGTRGLAEDVRWYGRWMRDEAEKRIGHLYPKVKITQEMMDDGRPDLKPYLGQELTVIAWLWARTVASPDPSVGGKHVPLVRSFWLSRKKGKEAYVQPVVDREKGTYEFKVRVGKPADGFDPDKGTKPSGRGSNFECILSGSPIDGNHIKSMGQSEGLQSRLMAVVCEGVRGRIYLNPLGEMELTAREANPLWKPEFDLIGKSADQLPLYGMKQYWQLFTPRQLTALTTFSDLVKEARQKVLEDALGAPASSRHICRRDGGVPRNNSNASGWYSRGYLPHFDSSAAVQHIVFRLHDSVPAEVLARWKEELNWTERTAPTDPAAVELRKRIERYEDQGHGSCLLARPEFAEVVQRALLHFDGARYRLLEWCIMPNHVHVLLETLPGFTLSSIVHSWKSFTANEINKIRSESGAVWAREFYDRFIRNDKHFEAVTKYIRENPVKAGLVKNAEEWRFGSAPGNAPGNAAGNAPGNAATPPGTPPSWRQICRLEAGDPRNTPGPTPMPWPRIWGLG